MHRILHAEVDSDGNLRPIEPLELPPGSRVLVTVTSEVEASETALLAEAALGADWDRPEEDAAWSHLHPVS